MVWPFLTQHTLAQTLVETYEVAAVFSGKGIIEGTNGVRITVLQNAVDVFVELDVFEKKSFEGEKIIHAFYHGSTLYSNMRSGQNKINIISGNKEFGFTGNAPLELGIKYENNTQSAFIVFDRGRRIDLTKEKNGTKRLEEFSDHIESNKESLLYPGQNEYHDYRRYYRNSKLGPLYLVGTKEYIGLIAPKRSEPIMVVPLNELYKQTASCFWVTQKENVVLETSNSIAGVFRDLKHNLGTSPKELIGVFLMYQISDLPDWENNTNHWDFKIRNDGREVEMNPRIAQVADSIAEANALAQYQYERDRIPNFYASYRNTCICTGQKDDTLLIDLEETREMRYSGLNQGILRRGPFEVRPFSGGAYSIEFDDNGVTAYSKYGEYWAPAQSFIVQGDIHMGYTIPARSLGLFRDRIFVVMEDEEGSLYLGENTSNMLSAGSDPLGTSYPGHYKCPNIVYGRLSLITERKNHTGDPFLAHFFSPNDDGIVNPSNASIRTDNMVLRQLYYGNFNENIGTTSVSTQSGLYFVSLLKLLEVYSGNRGDEPRTTITFFETRYRWETRYSFNGTAVRVEVPYEHEQVIKVEEQFKDFCLLNVQGHHFGTLETQAVENFLRANPHDKVFRQLRENLFRAASGQEPIRKL
ncbi:MAG: hypothetical protein KDB87_06780 [Flavobacteriales bacterium]|nr:hypothetical protein [Flavobacteriales bacterium]